MSLGAKQRRGNAEPGAPLSLFFRAIVDAFVEKVFRRLVGVLWIHVYVVRWSQMAWKEGQHGDMDDSHVQTRTVIKRVSIGS